MSKIKIDFLHVHDHSCFSRRDAHSKVKDLVAKAKSNGQRAVGLTDHGVLHGIPELFRESKKQGIKAIAGFEGYFAPQGRNQKGSHFHQLLLAKNKAGFHNAMKLSSEAFMSGFYNRPRFDWELLRKHSEGLILTSSCLAGMIPQAILKGEMKEARKIALEFYSIFADDFYLEIQPTNTAEQKMVNRELVKISEELGIELLATCDVHYVEPEDMKAHMGMLALGRQQKMADAPSYPSEESYWLKDSKTVYLDFKAQGFEQETIIKAMNNTGKIADQVDFELTKEKDHLPTFPLPEGYTDKDQLIGDMVKEGFMRKIPLKTKAYLERIKFELDVIRKKGYQDYFLIVSDAIKWGKENDIMFGWGRGSGAGSLIAFLLDITEVDPIIHGLYFERFLDITRSKMPDIDTDIEDEGRMKVIDYLKDKYGQDKVSQVINYGTMTAKLAFKNALMVYDIPFGQAQEISNMIPDKPIGLTIQDAYKLNPALVTKRKGVVIDKEKRKIKLEEIFDLAERFEGVVDKLSTHAGGILITPTPISDNFPVYGDKERMVTQWDKDDLESLGGVKFDFLGVKTLRMVSLCLKSIEAETGKKIDIFEIGRLANDPLIYEKITRGETQNSFQFNSDGMQQLCKAVKPTEFSHIVAINALYRPPALASGDTWRYARIKNGQEDAHYSHPDEKRITGETFGVITYQEHVMEIVHQFAGWDYGVGDQLRKKKAHELEEMRQQFVHDAFEKYDFGPDNHIFEKQMNELWDRIIQYMGYGFNKSHGVAYSMLSYVTVWLETYYEEHWQASLMSVKMGDQDTIAQVFQDVKRAGFEFNAPDVNLSSVNFTAKDGKIIFPLGMTLGVGDGAVSQIMKARAEVGSFTSMEHLLENVEMRVVSKRAMKPLILAGAFDSLYPELTRKEIYIQYLKFKKDAKHFIEEAEQMEWDDDIQAEFEKELLGVYISSHPLQKYHFRDWSYYSDGEQNVLVGGKMGKVKSFNDKKGNRMAFASIETLEGVRELVVFSSSMKKVEPFLKKGLMLMVTGKKDGEKLIVSKIKELD